jgi:hypothetical protein
VGNLFCGRATYLKLREQKHKRNEKSSDRIEKKGQNGRKKENNEDKNKGELG